MSAKIARASKGATRIARRTTSIQRALLSARTSWILSMIFETSL